jgi:hypothetical protein
MKKYNMPDWDIEVSNLHFIKYANQLSKNRIFRIAALSRCMSWTPDYKDDDGNDAIETDTSTLAVQSRSPVSELKGLEYEDNVDAMELEEENFAFRSNNPVSELGAHTNKAVKEKSLLMLMQWRSM